MGDTLKYRGVLIRYAEEALYISYSFNIYIYTRRGVYSLKIELSYSNARNGHIRNQYHPVGSSIWLSGLENGALLAWYEPY